MKTSDLAKFAKRTRAVLSKRSPEILTAIGIAGMITTAVLAVRATPKAMELIEEKKKEEGTDELTVLETVEAAWVPYVPAVVTGALSISCIVGASSVSAKRNAALAAAYTLSETALLEYQEKVLETVGEKKEQAIRDKVAEERVKKNPVNSSEVIVTGKGKTMFLDWLGGRHFESDIDTIKRAANEINRRIMLGDMYASLNDFYYEIDLPGTGIGDTIGWNVENRVELDFSAQLENDQPVIVMGFLRPPIHDFDSLY